jgi:DNA-binding beta-propeller fold protein YncE
VSPDGERLFVMYGYEHYILMLRTSDYALLDSVNVGEWLNDIAILPGSDYLYAASIYESNIYVIRVADGDVVATIRLESGYNLKTLAVFPGGQYIYVGGGANTVHVLRTADNKLVASIPLWDGCMDFGILPTGDRIYATHLGPTSISLFGY